MSENRFWKEIQRGLSGHVHMCRIESHAVASGFPDINYCIDGTVGHIELKYAEYPKTPDIRISQSAWFRIRTLHGGRPLIFAKLIKNNETYYCLYPGTFAKHLSYASDFESWIQLSRATMRGKIDWGFLVSVMKQPVSIY